MANNGILQQLLLFVIALAIGYFLGKEIGFTVIISMVLISIFITLILVVIFRAIKEIRQKPKNTKRGKTNGTEMEFRRT